MLKRKSCVYLIVLIVFTLFNKMEASSFLTVLVNNMIVIQSTNWIEKSTEVTTVVYNYAENDTVDVTCTSLNGEGYFTMEYSYANTLRTASDYSPGSWHSGVGFNAKLNNVHNNSYVTCSQQSVISTRVVVKFIMQTFNNKLQVTVNGLILRQKSVAANYFVINYVYVTYETLKIVCQTNTQDMQMDGRMYSSTCNNWTVTKDKAESSIEYGKNCIERIRCAAIDTRTGSTAEMIEFNLIETTINDLCPLYIRLPPENIILELYVIKNRKIIYYEYEDGEELALTCHTPCKNGIVLYVQLNNSKQTGRAPSAEDDIHREIRLILRQRDVTANLTSITTIPTEISTTTKFIIGSAGIFISVIILIIIGVLIRKCCYTKPNSQPSPQVPLDPYSVFYLNHGIFRRQYEQQENQYEEIN